MEAEGASLRRAKEIFTASGENIMEVLLQRREDNGENTSKFETAIE